MAGSVRVERRGGRLDVVLDRPDKLNALNRDMLSQLRSAFQDLPTEARVVVLSSSAERSFCVGADLDEHRAQTPAQAFDTSTLGSGAMQAIASCPVPVVAQIEGWCLGGGLELALACDLRVASATAVLGFPEVSLGNTPAWGGVPRLVELVGVGRAKSMLLSARRMDAAEAASLALVEHVYAKDVLRSAVDELAETIAGHPSHAVRAAKAIVVGSTGSTASVLDALSAGFFQNLSQSAPSEPASGGTHDQP